MKGKRHNALHHVLSPNWKAVYSQRRHDVLLAYVSTQIGYGALLAYAYNHTGHDVLLAKVYTHNMSDFVLTSCACEDERFICMYNVTPCVESQNTDTLYCDSKFFEYVCSIVGMIRGCFTRKGTHLLSLPCCSCTQAAIGCTCRLYKPAMLFVYTGSHPLHMPSISSPMHMPAIMYHHMSRGS